MYCEKSLKAIKYKRTKIEAAKQPRAEGKLNLLFIKYQESKMPPQPNADEKKFGK
jgi:hypothetical protein